MAAFVVAHEGMHPSLPEPVHVRFVEAPPFGVPAPKMESPPVPNVVSPPMPKAVSPPMPAPAPRPPPASPARARRVPPPDAPRAEVEAPVAPAQPVPPEAPPAPVVEPVAPAASEGAVTGATSAAERPGISHGDASPDPDAPVELPGDATPPRLAPGNAVPDYPPDARAARRTGVVVLRVIVTAEGRVSEVKVVDGSEPFVASAVRAVSGWRYEPARHRGRPISVYRTVRIPFRLAD